MVPPGVLRFWCSPDVSPQDLGSGWYFRAPERDDRRVWNHWSRPVCCVFGAPQTSPLRTPALAGISEPQRGMTGGCGIIGPARCAAIFFFFRMKDAYVHCPLRYERHLICRSRSPDKRRGGRLIPGGMGCDLGAPQTSPSRISALALALESVGEDSSPTLSSANARAEILEGDVWGAPKSQPMPPGISRPPLRLSGLRDLHIR